METEKKEYGIDGKCRYKLAILEGCRSCLFSTLCHLEQDKKERNLILDYK